MVGLEFVLPSANQNCKVLILRSMPIVSVPSVTLVLLRLILFESCCSFISGFSRFFLSFPSSTSSPSISSRFLLSETSLGKRKVKPRAARWEVPIVPGALVLLSRFCVLARWVPLKKKRTSAVVLVSEN